MKRQRVALILLCYMTGVGAAPQLPPRRDTPPPPIEAAHQERELQARIASEGLTVRLALELARVQYQRAAVDRAETTLLSARTAFPADLSLIHALADHYQRVGKTPEAMRLIEEAAAVQPADPNAYHLVATFYEEVVRKDSKLTPDVKLTYILKGLEAADRALALSPDHFEALVYKNILLRHQMRYEPDRGRQALLQQEADELRTRAMELQKRRGDTAQSYAASGATSPPPPAPPTRLCRPPEIPVGNAPLRVGGNITAPAKTKDVRPVYPSHAQNARIQGVVIIEATIGEDGRIAQSCVLRSIPYLDEAALDAVAQWEFTPTLLNGVPVPVRMTVTVNFALE